MNDNIDTTNENSKKPFQRGDNNKNQRSPVSRDIKDRLKKAITEPNIEGDPTRSEEQAQWNLLSWMTTRNMIIK